MEQQSRFHRWGGDERSATGNLALWINNSGNVVGFSPLSDNSTFHVFLWNRETGRTIDLGTVPGVTDSAALAINDNGVVVGVSSDATHLLAAIWKHGTAIDLNTLIPANSPLYLLTVCSINSGGQIIGLAVDGNGTAWLRIDSFGWLKGRRRGFVRVTILKSSGEVCPWGEGESEMRQRRRYQVSIAMAAVFTSMCVVALPQASAQPNSAAGHNDAKARDAVIRVLPLLQKSATIWSHNAECISCHHQGLGVLAVSVARERLRGSSGNDGRT